ncbi:MAG: ComF family protein [Spirochaetes bacterium]|nr:ComF family protein [Spirochaetota bacterium]
MRQLVDIVFDYFFPSHCIACGNPISVKDHHVCIRCFSTIQPLERGCKRCGGQLVNNACSMCSMRAWYLDMCFAVSDYSGTMKEMLVKYKFYKWRRLYKKISELLYAALLDASWDVDVVTAVPMAKSKVRKRGFNQSELVAKDVAQKIRKSYVPLLKEVRVWKTQKDLNYVDRFLNVLGRFAVEGKLAGERILLIDDVYTTGATLNECARLLKNAGAGKVFGIAFAKKALHDDLQ